MTMVQEIRHKMAASNTSFRENIHFLGQLGNYFEQTIPSKIDHASIIETEALLNDLYVRSLYEIDIPKVTEQLRKALSQAGSLAIVVNRDYYGSALVEAVKHL